MPANASSQTTTHSGGDSSIADSSRINEQHQQGQQHSNVTLDQSRNGTESRTTDSTRREDSTNSRDSSSLTATARGQKVSGATTQDQTTTETGTTEHPLVLRRSTESGGGSTQTCSEDFAVQVEWEIEITSPLMAG